MARTFSGISQSITCSTGALASTVGAGITVMAILKLGTTSGGIFQLGTTTSAGKIDFQVFSGNFYFETDDTNASTVLTASTAENWTLVGASKASGTVVPRGHKYVYDTNTFTHAAGANTVPNASGSAGAGGVVQIGAWETSDYFSGDIALMAVWLRVLSDAEVENLAFSLQAWYASAPDAMWILDQADTAQKVIDVTGGGANQSAIAGTSVSANSVPVFSYGEPVQVLSSSAAAGGGTPVSVADTPNAPRLGDAPATFTIDQLTADSPRGPRIGASPATVAVDIFATDTPNGMRLGATAVGVTIDSGTGDTPSPGLRIGATGSTVTFGIAVPDSPTCLRIGSSPAGVSVDVFTADGPSGLRVGVSPASVSADFGASDVPTGLRVGASPTGVTYDQFVGDAPTGLRVGASPAGAGTSVAISDVPSGMRLGATDAAGVTLDILLADTPSGLRIGASPVATALGVALVDLPTGLRVGASPATVASGPVSVADTPSGLRLGISPATVTTAAPGTTVLVPDVYVVLGPDRVGVSLAAPEVSVEIMPVDIHVVLK